MWVRCRSKTEEQKHMFVKEIGSLRAQNLLINLVNSQHNPGGGAIEPLVEHDNLHFHNE